jgi:hypothetical protein
MLLPGVIITMKISSVKTTIVSPRQYNGAKRKKNKQQSTKHYTEN